VAYALINMIGNASNIYGSYFFPLLDALQYRRGGIILSAFAGACMVFAMVLGFLLRRLNKQAEAEERRTGVLQYKYLW
jgi:hypothetical protein